MKNKNGFTLVELLVVVLIIGVLSAIAIPQYFKVVAKTQTSEALVVLKNIVDAQRRYFILHDNYARNFASLDLSFIDQNGNRITGSEYSTKNFTYTLITEPNTGDITSAEVVATPINSQVACTINYQFVPNRVITCMDNLSGKGDGLCTSLGLTLAQTPVQEDETL